MVCGLSYQILKEGSVETEIKYKYEDILQNNRISIDKTAQTQKRPDKNKYISNYNVHVQCMIKVKIEESQLL